MEINVSQLTDEDIESVEAARNVMSSLVSILTSFSLNPVTNPLWEEH